jgi:hypothetical protein
MIVGLVLSALTDAFLLEHHGEFWWSNVYGFFALYGLAGCLAIIAVAKLIVGPLLQRDEDYYKRRRPG